MPQLLPEFLTIAQHFSHVALHALKTNTADTYQLAGSAEDIDALKGYAIGRLDVQRNALDIMWNSMSWAKEEQPAVVVPARTPSRAPSIGHGLGM